MKKVSELNVKEIEKKINYTFKDKSLLIQAFTRTSFCNETNPTVKVKYQSNEVLEFFGDGVLSLSIISFLLKECTERYEHGIKTELKEGDFSNIKSKLSDKQNLSRSMKALGLEKYLLMGEGDAKLGIQNEPSVMEDLFESIVGAIFIDSDMSIGAVISAVSGMLDMSVYTSKQKIAQSAKNALQEWCADKKHRLPPPRYETLSEDGPDHKKTYMRACYIGDKLMGRGIGKNFKLADAAAAEDALQALMANESQNIQTKVVKVEDKVPVDAKNLKDNKSVNPAKVGDAKPTEAIKEIPVEEAKKKTSSATLLKNYATSNKKTSPAFKDLGERKSGQKNEYAVECSFIGETTVGVGSTRPEARENACKLMAEKLGIGKKKKTTKAKTKASEDTKPEQGKESDDKPSTKADTQSAAEDKNQSSKSEKTTVKEHTKKAQTHRRNPGKKPSMKKKRAKTNKATAKTK